eukprot:6066756-Pleurochrysis_carterae.AAC.3
MGWNVRLCQNPEVGPPLPASTRQAQTLVLIELRFDQDLIFNTFMSRLLPTGEFINKYSTNTENYHSTSPAPIYHSHQPHGAGNGKYGSATHGEHLTPSDGRLVLNLLADGSFRRIQTVEPPRAGASDAAPISLSTGGEGSSSGLHGDATLPTTPHPATRRAEIPNEADDVEENTNNAEQESAAAA